MVVRRFTDVVNWSAMIAPGVMACKDGSLLAGWEVTGIDSESLEPAALAGRLGHLGFAISGLGDGETVWTVFERRPWKPGTMPEGGGRSERSVLDLLDVEARAMLSQEGVAWSDRLTLFYAWKPAAHGTLDDDLTGFAEAIVRVESRLASALALDRLAAAGSEAPCPLIGVLSGFLGWRHAPRFGPDDLPVGLDTILGADVRQPRRAGRLTVDGRPMAILALDGLPVRYGLAPFERFQNLSIPFHWVTRYEALSARTARRGVRQRQKFWRQGAADFVANVGGESEGRRDHYADDMAESLETVMARLSRGDEGHGHYVSLFLLRQDREEEDGSVLASRVTALRAMADDGHYGLREERENAVPALLSALPGHTGVNSRRAILRARAMADLMPSRSIWRGRPECPSPRLPAGTPALLLARARTGEAFHFNLHHGDLGHTLVFGPTGAGKSVLLGRIVAAWLRYPDAQAVYFDRQRSIAHACAVFGGTFIEPGVAGTGSIAPFSHVGRLGSQWGLSWLSALVEHGLGQRPSTDQAAELRRAVKALAETPRPTLRDVAEFVQERQLRQVIAAWNEGPDGGIFDSDRADIAAGLQASPFTVFETHTLFEANPAVSTLSVDYIFAETERMFSGRPTLVVLDEAWAFLRHPLWTERLRSWLKEGRKRGVAVVMATQSVADAARSELTADLLESSPTKVFLPNAEAGTRSSRAHYEALGLEPAQIAIIQGMRPKHDLYLTQPGGRRVISLPMGPATLSVLGRTGSDDSVRARRLAAEDPYYWMEDLRDDTDIDLTDTARRRLPAPRAA